MTDQNGKFDDPFDDELLSAYVDGELTSEELAQVEQRLADDPRAQQLVEELRALSQELQTLPPQTVGADLRATILQRAERAMLLGTEEPQVSKPRAFGSSRRWMWPAIALAATLLLTVFLPNAQQDEKPLASAKPVSGEPKRAEPRLESVATEEPEVSGDALVAQPDFQVLLTVNDSEEGIAQFNQLLVSNGITLEETGEQEEESNQKSGPEIAAAETNSFAKRRDKVKELSEAQQSEHEEVVLVEATTEQIENLLEAYNADVQNFFSIRLASEQKPTTLPLDQWQQWERGGKQLAQNKLQGQNELKKLRRAKKSARQAQLGRAMRLNTRQFQRQGNGVLNLEQNLFSKNDSPSKVAAKAPMQVLFILQKISQSAPGEPATIGESR